MYSVSLRSLYLVNEFENILIKHLEIAFGLEIGAIEPDSRLQRSRE